MAEPEREMLAKLLAHIATSGNTGKYSPENLWALQGPGQFPPPPPSPDQDILRPQGRYADGMDVPIKRVNPSSDLEFPIAQYAEGITGGPFPGAESVIADDENAHDKAYALPKSKKKKGKR